MRKLITILGSPLDILSMPEAIDRMVEFATNGHGSQKYHQVATVNVDFLVKATSDPELRGILQSVDMATIDGMPLVWGGRWLGADIPQRVAGSDFVPLLVQRAAMEGLSIFLLGATPEVSTRAAKILQDQHPELIISGIHSPPFRPVLEMDPTIVEKIKSADPDILLVAFGNPKQEKWIDVYGPQVNVPLMIGVGATLDFIAGEMKRAPRWMQIIGLEWLFRMLQEPRRLYKRYIQDIYIFGTHFIRQWWLQHPQVVNHPQPNSVTLQNHGKYPTMKFQGKLTKNETPTVWHLGKQALAESNHIALDLSDCTFLDSLAIGALMGLVKQARDQGGETWITSVSPKAKRILTFHKMDSLFILSSNTRPNRTKDEHGKPEDQLQNLNTRLVKAEGMDWLFVETPRRLDGKTSLLFHETFKSIVDSHQRIILDLSDTVYLSSGGLAMLEKISRQAETSQGQLMITNLSPDIQQVLKIHKYDQKLMTCRDFSNAQ